MTTFFETAKRKKRPTGWIFRTLRFAFNATLILVAAVFILIFGLYLYIVNERGENLKRRYPILVENSHVFDASGNRIGLFHAEEDRETVPFEDFGEHLPKAVVAIEDRRFYDHIGVDFEGVARAAWTDLRSWEVQEGGSTITEQLMKNVFVPEEERFEVSFWRRLVQACLAFFYERHHTKEEILTAYLNAVYFGNGAYGAEVAAQRYFDKSAGSLTLSEAATLAGFLHAPSTYAPGSESVAERAARRRDEVLERMQEQGMISAAERRRAQASEIKFSAGELAEDPAYESFLDKVRREVEEHLGAEALERGGLRIQTTLDSEMQHEAVAAADEVLYGPDDPSAAVVSVEPQSGAIRALAGRNGSFNLALDARRQPGSSFKPIVLATALKEGISPESVYVSEAIRFSEDHVINNYDYVDRGEISLHDAMAQSDNTVFVRLAMDLGLEKVVRTAKEMGITSPLEPYPSTAIGGLGVGLSPLEMASAYATFAGGGIYREPYGVERVDRLSYGERETLYDHRLVGKRMMSGNQAATATWVLRQVVENGTASHFHDLDAEIGRPSAGKTGTTDDFVDAWYVGYTPRLSTSVWVGYPEGSHSMAGVHGIEEAGGETLPLDLWALYMERATEEEPVLEFPDPDLSKFDVLDRGYYAGAETAPEDGLEPVVPDDLGDKIQDAVDKALQDAFGG